MPRYMPLTNDRGFQVIRNGETVSFELREGGRII